jgi:hypothetical protein
MMRGRAGYRCALSAKRDLLVRCARIDFNP